MLKNIIKKMLRSLLGDYSAYFIYTNMTGKTIFQEAGVNAKIKISPVDSADIVASADPLIRNQAGYAGAGSRAYACFDHDRLVGVCFYWFGERYMERNFWPLKNGEAKLVQIITLPEARGAGVASSLIAQSCRHMEIEGFTAMFARIWHSNTPSIKAFERAGWARIALVLEINPLRHSRPHRIQFNIKARETRIQQP